ncbi:unnamed protein product [Phytomonas sp. Hart1]|nr:unnamed protein product [Phytomonas sp. Hart1]|eukprot:CCW67070.1 unnamed protein product [Phytomonas sp. isolate Hart1]
MLTEELILEKTSLQRLEDVRRLNLWGKGLVDVSIVAKLKNIEVLALVSNHVCSLRFFASCTFLQELYLRKNDIIDLGEVGFLKNLTKLHTLWLTDNPCAKHPRYREFVLHCCSSLKKLDSMEVLPAERAAAEKSMSQKVVNEIMSLKTEPTPIVLSSGKLAASTTGAKSLCSSSFREEPPWLSSTKEHHTDNVIVNDTRPGAQHAMLTAIVALLPELTMDSLEMLEQEVHDRVELNMIKLKKLPSNSL